MASHSDFRKQAKQAAESAERVPEEGRRKMLRSFARFYEALADQEVRRQPVSEKRPQRPV